MNKKNYKILARKYRPTCFKNIYSQDHIVKIIQSSIKNNKIHHSYLLSGIRGVGKTSFARIMALSFNCERIEQKYSIESCLNCYSCKSILECRQQDIIEIDAASNTGVNDIRDIIENSKYKPLNIKYKIFIIDEAHMLSNSAFNALLKILEEPPNYSKFIMATTELSTIPYTVLSRCQRFDLKRFSVIELISYLSFVIKKEGYSFRDNIITIIAKSSNGSLRDALSILERVFLISNNTITYNSILNTLSLTNFQYVCQIFISIINGNIKKVLKISRDIYNHGGNINNLIKQLSDLVYKVFSYKICSLKNILLSDTEREFCILVYKKVSSVTLIRLWYFLQKVKQSINCSYQEQIVFEMSMIKLIYINFEILPIDVLKSS